MASKKAKPKAAKREATPEEKAHDKQRQKEGWKRQQRADIEKWEPGMEVSGVFLELRPGSMGQLVDLRDEEGKLRTYGAPTILASLLKPFDKGTEVLIECVGKIRNAKNQETWDFRIYTREGADTGTSDDDTGFEA